MQVDMNDKLFAELLESVREGAAILRSEKAPSRTFVLDPAAEQSMSQQQDAEKAIQSSKNGAVNK